MNKGLLVLNIGLLLAVGVLYFLFFTKKDRGGETIVKRTGVDTATKWEHTPVAYFEMDSIEANFSEFKRMQDEVLKKEQIKNDSSNYLKMSFQSYMQKLQPYFEKGTQREKDSINLELSRADADIKNRIAELNQRFQTYYVNKQQEIIMQIKNYCTEFNKDKKYAYIIAKEPGLFYFTDDAYNITTELVKGLNEYYSKAKKK